MGRPAASDPNANPAPETMEGWWLLHDLLYIDRDSWQDADPEWRQLALDEFSNGSNNRQQLMAAVQPMPCWATSRPHAYSSPRRCCRHACGRKWTSRITNRAGAHPATSYVSIAEASLYEATGAAHGRLAQRGLSPGKEGFEEAFAMEFQNQKSALKDRVFRSVPEKAYVCYYPMSKRRGEQENWYAMPLDERRALMRGHGKLGRKYSDRVTQIIGGSTGLDDWEWSVDLHSDDMLVFKKLVYEMRFDPASARFAEFGPFYVGSRCANADALAATFGGAAD